MTHELKQLTGLVQKPTQVQKLILTPQLQQAIRLLQLSRIELQETIQTEIETNPLLEEGTDENFDREPETIDRFDELTITETSTEVMDWENYLSENNTGWAGPLHEDRDFPSFENYTANKTNLTDHLTWQLGMSDLADTQKEIGAHIVGNLDVNGYLKASREEIAQTTGYAEEEVTEVLRAIQRFDPMGVAARDLRECLLIQLRFQGMGGTLVERILLEHMDMLENRKYDQIARSLSVSVQDVLDAVSIIKNLEPKPGRQFNNERTVYITPDVYVFKVGSDYHIVLNEDGMPKLRVNHYYRQILSDKTRIENGTREYILDRIKLAEWLIKSIHQRQRTIYRVTESIVRFQRDFLDQGITYLKTLVLRDVAAKIKMHESTVSRATANKYVHTPQGIFELKFFFNSGIKRTDGDAVASESVKQHIRNIIKSEDVTKPYGDQTITDILKKINIPVARRTIAKYRESIGILPSRRRKSPYTDSNNP
jgi:RNA polymerase sigma-54 factor